MVHKHSRVNVIFAISVISLMVAATIGTAVFAGGAAQYKGFEKGIPWKSFTPMKRVTLVEFDKESYVDDYAYLASIPSSVFNNGDVLFSNPVLFFQADGTYPDEDKNLFLNDYNSIHYFMEDWMSYCGNRLDKLTSINVDKSDFEDSWNSRNYTMISSSDPFEIACQIALNDWSYANQAVISVIEEDYEKPDNSTINSINGKISGEVAIENFKVKRSYGTAPEYERFTVEDEYKYIKADLWYSAVVINSKIMEMIPGFPSIITIPSYDPDLQLYCSYDNDWLQTASSSDMTITNGPHEACFSYVYRPGTWRVGVTNMPTEGGDEDSFTHYLLPGILKDKFLISGSNLEAFFNILGKPVTEYDCKITKYPGEVITVPDNPPFGCRDATFKIDWNDDDVTLGLSILGPNGEELESVMEEDESSQEIHFEQLGECPEGTHYSVVVYALEDIHTPLDFTIEYSWHQNISKKEGDLIASACEGAVLASALNAPLLYTTPEEVPESTIEALLKLGVKDICIIDIGEYLTDKARNQLSGSFEITEHLKTYRATYSHIMNITGSNDVVFSTIDPWSYWYYTTKAKEIKPAGEFQGAFYFGPATYAAAHHGTPLLLVDNHEELSSAVTWHNEYWKKNGNGYTHVPVAQMVLTGREVYSFLRDYGFDKEGKESILSVAGQYDIAPSWTRVFAGVANPGTIIGTPVDSACWVSRNIFYPALIFENPALQGKVELTNGSKSERVQPELLGPFQALIQRLKYPFGSNLNIMRASKEERYTYPILHTYGCYSHRFNERASAYWGVKYQSRDGIIPGVTKSEYEIDEGTRVKYEGLYGAFYPDISETEVVPFYCSKAGYENVFSTNFDVTIENLNSGVISWYMVLHGDSQNGGQLSWYSPTSIEDTTGSKLLQLLIGVPLGLLPTVETNPWRGYDQLWGSTEEPDTATLNAEIGLILGWLGLANPGGRGVLGTLFEGTIFGALFQGGIIKIGLDLVPANIPLNKWNRNDYFDGLVGPYSITAMITKFHYAHPGKEYNEKLENLHSMSFHADSCLIACKFLHISFIRHGSVMQELDPWPTSYWGGFAFEQTPRDLALGKTIGESYSEGRTSIGVQYLFEEDEEIEWWWDSAENVVLFSDPDLRLWVPSNEWDMEEKNNWEKEDILPLSFNKDVAFSGHMPFGATDHPNERNEMPLWQQLLIWGIVIVILVLILVIVIVKRKKK
jgi:hypothetical protein